MEPSGDQLARAEKFAAEIIKVGKAIENAAKSQLGSPSKITRVADQGQMDVLNPPANNFGDVLEQESTHLRNLATAIDQLLKELTLMISDVDGSRIQIRQDSNGQHSLTCAASQVAGLQQLWREKDFSPFEVREDSVVVDGEPDAQVTVVFGSGDPIDRYQQVLDAVSANGLS